MDVSILICTQNRRESLGQTLDALGRIRRPDGLQCELIVVDNASTDGTDELIKRSRLPNQIPIVYRSVLRKGKSFALNAGLAAARGRFILFTDDDVRPAPDWIQGMCTPLLGGAHAVAGGVTISPHLERPWMGELHRIWLGSTENLDPANPAYMVGANMAISREVLSRVPSFDEELGPGALGFHEDSLFTHQLKLAGYKVVSAFGLTVEHHFDQLRLTRASLTNIARKMACSSAYLAHHWEHEEVSHLYKQLAGAQLRLARWRWRRREECRGTEGMPEWEMELVRDLHFLQHYRLERLRPRRYERKGLRALSAAIEP